jgi:hypothetical protein
MTTEKSGIIFWQKRLSNGFENIIAKHHIIMGVQDLDSTASLNKLVPDFASLDFERNVGVLIIFALRPISRNKREIWPQRPQ